jgi:hypothetical protein
MTPHQNPCDHRPAGNQNKELCYPMKTVCFGRPLLSSKMRHIILFRDTKQMIRMKGFLSSLLLGQ